MEPLAASNQLLSLSQSADEDQFMDEMVEQLSGLSPSKMVAQISAWEQVEPGIGKKVMTHALKSEPRRALRELSECGQPSNTNDARDLVFYHDKAIKAHADAIHREKDPAKSKELIDTFNHLVDAKHRIKREWDI